MSVRPFTLAIEQSQLDDLKQRLLATRWPEKELVDDWSQGAPLARVRALCDYWAQDYDWRRCEKRLNELGQYVAQVDDMEVHFLHIRSPHENAMPLLLTHGWPGSIVEFLDVIAPLTRPEQYGGSADQAFHLIIPSIPGYGFSSKPKRSGFGVDAIAGLWIKLMAMLGYETWVAQGGDWGSSITTAIGKIRPKGCLGIHLNFMLAFPNEAQMQSLSPKEQASLAAMARYQEEYSGYAKLQSTRPQTIGYALSDSPAGQAAWIYEKIWEWTDAKNEGDFEAHLGRDAILDNIMLYWLPANAASSARLYWESLRGFTPTQLDLPVGVSVFPSEITRPSREWAEPLLSNLIHWGEAEKGGHFAAWEQPEIFVKELRSCFAKLR